MFDMAVEGSGFMRVVLFVVCGLSYYFGVVLWLVKWEIGGARKIRCNAIDGNILFCFCLQRKLRQAYQIFVYSPL